jgi:hypothetical protein
MKLDYLVSRIEVSENGDPYVLWLFVANTREIFLGSSSRGD